MSFDIQKLRDITAPRGGLATTERYEVSFKKLPTILQNEAIVRDLTFYCDSVALPTKSINASDKMIYGTSYQMPYRHAFQELSLSFYLTNDMEQKKFFDTWQTLIIDPLTGDLGFHNDYTCDIDIKKFRRTDSTFNTPDYQVRLERAWPSIVAEVQLTHGGGSEIGRLPVTMQYKKWLAVV